MTLRDIALICFAAASVIHGSQTVLVAKLRRERKGLSRGEAIEGIAVWGAAFLWQFGNFLLALAATPQFDGPAEGWHTVFWTANLVRDVVLATFPLLFSYICSQIPADGSKSARLLLRLGRILRYLLWPLTGVAVVAMVAADTGFPLPFLSSDLAGWVILHTMLFYLLIFMVSTVARHAPAQSGVPARMRAHKATVIAAVVGVTVFVLMLSGYWHLPVPFLQYIGLAAMLTSVPFSIASAYKLYQYPFMDAFIREVLSGVILLAIFAAALSANSSVLWITFCAVVLVYSKAPLTRWVERTFLGYGESVEEQEERIGTAIRALTQLDEFAARVSEILSKELEADWVEIPATGAGCERISDSGFRSGVIAGSARGWTPVHEPAITHRSHCRAAARSTSPSAPPAEATGAHGASRDSRPARADQSAFSVQHAERACQSDPLES